MIKKLLIRYRDFMNKPVFNKIDEVNKNLNFLINQTVKMEDVKTPPSLMYIQGKQYDILLRLTAFFDKIGMDYFLTYGTLLGAVRHQGFVPWDDDIDIAVFNEDFHKIIQNEEELEKLGLRLSSPFSKHNNFTYVGWHKVYDLNTKHHISIFTFDIVNSKDAKKIVQTRTKYNAMAYSLRKDFQAGKYSFEALKVKLNELNQSYFKEFDFVTKDTAGEDAYIIKNICNYSEPNITKFRYIYPLKRVNFSLGNKYNEFLIPNIPEGVLQDFYGRDYMYFPKNVFPIHPHNHKIEE